MMKTNYLIAVDKFCANHEIEVSFISSLQENGLIQITTIKDVLYIDRAQLLHLEKMVRLYFELDINLEGIETINHLLKRIGKMQDEITALRNQLNLHEFSEVN
jgi:hypothetical protein